GWGQPVFSWRVNGVDVSSGGGSVNVQASVKQDSTTDPQQYTTSLQNMSLNCNIYVDSQDYRRSTLVIHVPPNVVGHVDLTIEIFANERFVSPSVQVSDARSITADNETVTWEERYYRNSSDCENGWKAFLHRYEIPNLIPLVLTLPDPK